MKRIVLKSGKEYKAQWCAVSTMDNMLRLSISGVSFIDAFPVFSDPAETQTIEYYMNDNDSQSHNTFEGYTILQGVVAQGEAIIITLKEGA